MIEASCTKWLSCWDVLKILSDWKGLRADLAISEPTGSRVNIERGIARSGARAPTNARTHRVAGPSNPCHGGLLPLIDWRVGKGSLLTAPAQERLSPSDIFRRIKFINVKYALYTEIISIGVTCRWIPKIP